MIFPNHALTHRGPLPHPFDQPLDVRYRGLRQNTMTEIEDKRPLSEGGKNGVDRTI
jgi:hypothetical protein